MHSNARTRVSYRTDNYQPLAEAGVLDLVDDDQTIMPGVRVRRTGGHTMHHQAIWIESKGQHAVYPADLVPTTAHLPPAWILGIDSYPMDSLTAKQAFLREAVEREALVFFDHDPAVPMARIREQNGKWHIQQ
jgi:glyoxylase-like metal-dependent hydrolase (beta-lactamase superfamily II)